ncbi:MAG: hypothetical protein GF408_07355 [Candidatus Omnitrophica bacterium]|nr:hypothetical protein [Candidatus Omnitrophota bacterium]
MEFTVKLIQTIDRVPGVRSFRFERPDEADFKAGQYMILTIPVKGKDTPKAFSFSSSPTEKEYLEFTKRFTDSDYSAVLKSMEPGDAVKVRMPMGKFILDESRCDKLAFLSGGIGITPFKSMCGYAADTGSCKDIVLLYGNNDPDSVIFREELDRMQRKNPLFRVVYALTSPEAEARESSCERKGYIDSCMIEEEIPDKDQRTFYVCGPPAMVTSLVGVLKDGLGVADERIILENFQGY